MDVFINYRKRELVPAKSTNNKIVCNSNNSDDDTLTRIVAVEIINDYTDNEKKNQHVNKCYCFLFD